MRSKLTPRFVVFVAATLLTVLLAVAFLMLGTSEVPSHAMPIKGASSPLGANTASASAGEGATVLRMINRSRVAHHLRPLRLRTSISDSARRHSRQMMNAGRLFHSAGLVHLLLSTTMATRWGEDVGCGSSIAGIDRAWMGSPLHRLNILDPRFSRAGIGVWNGHSKYWITLDFYG